MKIVTLNKKLLCKIGYGLLLAIVKNMVKQIKIGKNIVSFVDGIKQLFLKFRYVIMSKLNDKYGVEKRMYKCKNCNNNLITHDKYCYECYKLKGSIK